METAEQIRARVDAMSMERLIRDNRFAPVGDPRFRGEEGEYRITRLAQLRQQDPAGYVAASKFVGW